MLPKNLLAPGLWGRWNKKIEKVPGTLLLFEWIFFCCNILLCPCRPKSEISHNCYLQVNICLSLKFHEEIFINITRATIIDSKW